MSVITEFIHFALTISGLAFNPAQNGLIVDMEMRELCYFSKNSLHEAAVMGFTLFPEKNGKKKNVILSNSGDYLQWSFNPLNSRILALKNGSIVNCFDINGNSADSFKVISPFPVYKVFQGKNTEQLFCVHSKPLNTDYEESGAGLFDRNTNSYMVSPLVHSQELAVTAAWNVLLDYWVITDNFRRKISVWKNSDFQSLLLNSPPDTENLSFVYNVDESGSFVSAHIFNLENEVSFFWVGEITADSISWRDPLPVKSGIYENFAVNTTGTRLALLETIHNDNIRDENILHIVNTQNVNDAESEFVPLNCIGNGIGWISENEVICAGSSDLMMVNLGKTTKKSVSENNLKKKL